MSELNPPTPTGFTVQVYVPASDLGSARRFYVSLFGREPDFEPHDDFLEWAIIPRQETWFQLVGSENFSALTNRVRFRVEDIHAAVAFVDQLGVERSKPSLLPNVVAFFDFSDPWGNRLGYYQDLVETTQQAEYPGTSVSDASLFGKLDDS